MGLNYFHHHHHRKLMDDSINDTLEDLCSSDCDSSNDSGFCILPCLDFCPKYCHYPSYSLYPPPSPPLSSYHHQIKQPSKLLFISLIVLAATFLALCCFAIYVKFYIKRRRNNRSHSHSQSQPQTNDDFQFLDHEDHGLVVDHPIWYINTIGLQSSVISAITICKYKKDEGLIEGTECSVCLSEFEEDETLRLLPKCNHAFHIPCIDTWLRSHTNCPMCRAPIVKNTTLASSSGSNTDNLGSTGDTQMDSSQDNEEMERGLGLEDGVEEEDELRVEHRSEKLDGMWQPTRRSISLDSPSATKISQSLSNFISEGNSETQLAKENDLSIEVVDSAERVDQNESLPRFVGSSSIGRSLQNGPSSLKRSFSCSGKLLLSRFSRNQN